MQNMIYAFIFDAMLKRIDSTVSIVLFKRQDPLLRTRQKLWHVDINTLACRVIGMRVVIYHSLLSKKALHVT